MTSEHFNPLIHRAGKNDAPVVADLIHKLLNELTGGNAPAVDEMIGTAKRLIEEERIVCLIAEFDEQPIGVLGLNDCAAIYAGGEFGEITELYVLPEFRSMTVASRLIGEARAIAREREWKRLEVCAPVQPAWDRTLRFYLREGFQEVGPRLISRL